jgi:lipid-binding SYLF domain-containing protein
MRYSHAMWVAAMITSLAGAGLAKDRPSVDTRLQAATRVFKDMAAPPDSTIPRSALDRAQCVVVIPNVKRAAFVVGGEHGAGFISCREGAAGWSAPGGVSLTGGTIGAQIGGENVDLVILATNQRAKDALLANRMKIGTSATAAAGPVGRSHANAEADLLTWSHSSGAFAGITINGSELSQDNDANRALYGRALSNIEIASGKIAAPPAAGPLLTALRDYATRNMKSAEAIR